LDSSSAGISSKGKEEDTAGIFSSAEGSLIPDLFYCF
jgi:hypothetical protein